MWLFGQRSLVKWSWRREWSSFSESERILALRLAKWRNSLCVVRFSSLTYNNVYRNVTALFLSARRGLIKSGKRNAICGDVTSKFRIGSSTVCTYFPACHHHRLLVIIIRVCTCCDKYSIISHSHTHIYIPGVCVCSYRAPRSITLKSHSNMCVYHNSQRDFFIYSWVNQWFVENNKECFN